MEMQREERRGRRRDGGDICVFVATANVTEQGSPVARISMAGYVYI